MFPMEWFSQRKMRGQMVLRRIFEPARRQALWTGPTATYESGIGNLGKCLFDAHAHPKAYLNRICAEKSPQFSSISSPYFRRNASSSSPAFRKSASGVISASEVHSGASLPPGAFFPITKGEAILGWSPLPCNQRKMLLQFLRSKPMSGMLAVGNFNPRSGKINFNGFCLANADVAATIA